jgi:hypothetical protein
VAYYQRHLKAPSITWDRLMPHVNNPHLFTIRSPNFWMLKSFFFFFLEQLKINTSMQQTGNARYVQFHNKIHNSAHSCNETKIPWLFLRGCLFNGSDSNASRPAAMIPLRCNNHIVVLAHLQSRLCPSIKVILCRDIATYVLRRPN